jgi:hypothetical protein
MPICLGPGEKESCCSWQRQNLAPLGSIVLSTRSFKLAGKLFPAYPLPVPFPLPWRYSALHFLITTSFTPVSFLMGHLSAALPGTNHHPAYDHSAPHPIQFQDKLNRRCRCLKVENLPLKSFGYAEAPSVCCDGLTLSAAYPMLRHQAADSGVTPG